MTMGHGGASARFEFRIDVEGKRVIHEAAAALGMAASDFARGVLLARAEEVLAERVGKTVVPARYFDDLLAALDRPAEPNEALRRAQARAWEVTRAEHIRR